MTIFMKFILLIILILLFYFFNQRFIVETFALAPEQSLGNMVKDDLKAVQSEPVRTEGNINDLFLLPQERPGTLVKNTVGTPFGKSVSVEGDLSQASFVPERKAGTVLNKMFGVSLKPDRKLANLNKDCKSGCTFQCEGEKCYTNGDIGAEPVLNEKYKNEVVFNTMLQANFLLEDKIDGQDQVLSSVNVDDWMTIRKKIADKNTYSGDKDLKKIVDHNRTQITKKYRKQKKELDLGKRLRLNITYGNKKGEKKWKKYKKKIKKKNKEIKDKIKREHFKKKFLKKLCDKDDSFRFARLYKMLHDVYGPMGEDMWITEENFDVVIDTMWQDNKELLRPNYWSSFLDLKQKYCIKNLETIKGVPGQLLPEDDYEFSTNNPPIYSTSSCDFQTDDECLDGQLEMLDKKPPEDKILTRFIRRNTYPDD